LVPFRVLPSSGCRRDPFEVVLGLVARLRYLAYRGASDLVVPMQVGADVQTIYRAIDLLCAARFDEVFADTVTGTGEDTERVRLTDVAPLLTSGGTGRQLDVRVRIGCCRRRATHPSIVSTTSLSVAMSSRACLAVRPWSQIDLWRLVHGAVVDAAVGELDVHQTEPTGWRVTHTRVEADW
jgi:hypothetical protein